MAGDSAEAADVAIGSTAKTEDSDAPVKVKETETAPGCGTAEDAGAASFIPVAPSIQDECDISEAPVLSKNQQKKLAKRAKFVEQRQARKQNRKEQVRQRIDGKR
jgi:hypothetical protein